VPIPSATGQIIEWLTWVNLVATSRATVHLFLPLNDRGVDGFPQSIVLSGEWHRGILPIAAYHQTMRRFLFLSCLLLAACGSSASTPTAAPTPTFTLVPTATPPDSETVTLGASGVGVYQLISVPVVIIQNQAVAHSAMGVVVHLTVTRGGRPQDSTDASAVDLAPQESIAVAGDCTDTCTGADGVSATITVGSWGEVKQAPTIKATGTAVSGAGGRGQGDVSATLSATGITKGALISGFAACYSPAGTIVGGGSSTFSWAGTPSQSATIPVIVSSAVARCDVYAAIGG
jgi:hypothetical protein